MQELEDTAADDRLTDREAGHLRHFRNLSYQPPNDWSSMQGRGTGQDDFGGYRFQLAYMAYALALAHRHRLPAAPGVFKPIMKRLIDKMLLPEVWMYWARVSRGGSVFNAHVSEKLHEEWDPVVKDNIMYSAYVQSMALLYHYLFDDDRYAKPGALTFRYWSFFWGGPERRFEYDENKLNEHIYWQMVESGFIGVACEPNCVFQICNQPAILGFRLHDLIHGGSLATEVTDGYRAAWEQFGHVGENGHFNMMLAEDTKAVRANAGHAPWVDAWCGTLMNMWNRDFVHAHYKRPLQDWLVPSGEGALSVKSSARPLIMGQSVVNDDSDFGWAAAWASEMGDKATLDGLLTHADRHMAPTWRDGGFYFPRNDHPEDSAGHRTLVEPMTGNVLLGFAALNVPDGLHKLYAEPWDRARHGEPALVRVGSQVDVLRARFDRPAQTLNFGLRLTASAMSTGEETDVQIGRLNGRSWTLRGKGGDVLATGNGGSIRQRGPLSIRQCDDGVVLSPQVGVPQMYSLELTEG